MKTRMEALKKQRVRVFGVYIAYFLLLLVVGALIFLKNAGHSGLMAAFCLVVYLMVIRPVMGRYQQELRKAMLELTLGSRLKDFSYSSKEGMTMEQLVQTGLVPDSLSTHLSRELITGQSDDFKVTLADVTYPIRNGNRNEMFSGCAIRLEAPDRGFAPLRVEHSTLVSGEAPEELTELTEGSIPGSVYVNTVDSCLYVILRGRLLGSKINALMNITEETLSQDPMPELDLVLKLAKKLRH